MSKSRSLFLLNDVNFRHIYSPSDVAKIQDLTTNDGLTTSAEEILSDPQAYQDVEIIFSGWSVPKMEADLLNALPNLKAFFYGAGSVRNLVTDAFWKRDILLTSAYKANAVPVAEFTVASVIFGLKQAWTCNRILKSGVDRSDSPNIAGVYFGSKVGVISLGAIGQLVCEKLHHLDLDVLAYDPFADSSVFERCGAQKVDSLDALFAECDVVSLHAPWLPQTEDLIRGEHLRQFKEGATFINTSRGAIVHEQEMVEVLQERPDLFAVIDVIQDESTYHCAALTGLPNVFLTPHIAGSKGRECHRMGAMAVEECRRYLSGEPPITPVTEANMALMA